MAGYPPLTGDSEVAGAPGVDPGAVGPGIVVPDAVVVGGEALTVPKARFQVYVSPTRCFWRLLGRNNRAYARSAQSSTSAEEVRALAILASRAAMEADVDLTSTRGREWEWVLTIDGVALARSNGTYGRRVECLASVDRFRLVAPGAPVTFVRFTNREAGRAVPAAPLARFRPGPPPQSS